MTDDPTRVRRETWRDDRDVERVVMYTIQGGGHNWPGGVLIDETGPGQGVKRSMLKRLYGKCTTVIDGGEELWRFFRRHELAP